MELPKTPRSHEAIVQYVKMLQESEGWKIIKEVIETSIVGMEEKLFNTEHMTLEDMNRLKDKRLVQTDLLHLPEKLVDLYSQEANTVNHDIYD